MNLVLQDFLDLSWTWDSWVCWLSTTFELDWPFFLSIHLSYLEQFVSLFFNRLSNFQVIHGFLKFEFGNIKRPFLDLFSYSCFGYLEVGKVKFISCLDCCFSDWTVNTLWVIVIHLCNIKLVFLDFNIRVMNIQLGC